MTKRVVLLSGPVGAGKSTLTGLLRERYRAEVVSTRGLLEDRAIAAGIDLGRSRLARQKYGETLDRDTGGRWVGDSVSRKLALLPDNVLVVVDGIRTLDQVESIRSAVSERVDHVHLTATRSSLESRYLGRGERSGLQEMASYDEVAANDTESRIGELGDDADIRIDSDRNSEEDVLIRCVARLGLLLDGGGYVDVLVGGQYGSEGKGNLAYYLAPEYDVLVRVGGPNAGHKVPLEGGEYTHNLLPSGTLSNPDAQLILGPGAVLRLDRLLKEVADCVPDGAERLAIDPQAMVVDEWDVDQETALVKGIGSTGSGTGWASARRIVGRGGNLSSALPDMPPVRLARDIPDLRGYLRPTGDLLNSALRAGKRILLEGTQGSALSLYHGHYPYVTSRDTTASGCLAEAGIGPRRVRRVIAVCRSYPIRVQSPSDGTSGAMRQELSWEDIAERAQLPAEDLTGREKGSVSGKQRRVGEFDWSLLRRTVDLNSATDIALTFADYVAGSNRGARRYDQLTQDTRRFVEEIEHVAGAPVSLISTRFERRCIIDRRRWGGR